MRQRHIFQRLIILHLTTKYAFSGLIINNWLLKCSTFTNQNEEDERKFLCKRYRQRCRKNGTRYR